MDAISSVYGLFLEGSTFLYTIGSVLALVVAGFTGAALWIWTALIFAIMIGFGVTVWLLAVFLVVMTLFLIPSLRANLISAKIMALMKKLKFLPQISQTEREALDAGVVWIEADLFSGKPNFKNILKEPYQKLTPEEQAFIDGPVQELCEALDEWSILKARKIPEKAWDIMRRERFFGMIIPKEYDGLGFSANAHAHVVMKVATRSLAAGITVMVPNSLGPAELLVHYGTKEQKDYYLPRLAKGIDIPCFALTEPTAGSDAGSILSNGTIFKGDDEKLYLKLNWNKRWITLASISTVIGLAFQLRDPDNLLGKGEDVGITCALIPSDTKGVVLGRRHDPLGIPFNNCPTQGEDVIVPADAIIGGIESAGKGWLMLMESLAAGRGISLPSVSTGIGKIATRAVSAHATVRKQFGLSIGKFEGIEEPLARIAGYNYLLEAMQKFTLGSIDKGIKPPVITAMTKYYSTEIARNIANDGMDILGGAGISMGPRNILGEAYIAAPISITVEGANILTRTLMIFGQGALRAHPYSYKEIKALEENDVKGFDKALFGHIGHLIRNTVRALVLSGSRGYLASSPVSGPTAKYYRRLSWASASFAILADIAMSVLGGKLKVKEKLTGRFADILSWMYICTAVLRRYEAEGRRKEDLPFVHFACQHALGEIQRAFDGIYANITIPGVTWLFKYVIRSWSRLNPIGTGDVTDGMTHKIAEMIQVPGEQRDRMTAGLFISDNPEEALTRLDNAFVAAKQAEPIEKKIKKAIRAKQLPKQAVHTLIELAKEKGIINETEGALLEKANTLRFDAIQVDDFSEEEYNSNSLTTSQTTGNFALKTS